MTTSQKLALRCSEVRERLNEIAGLEGDNFTPEIRQEADTLGVEYREVEAKWRAAAKAEGDDAAAAGSQFGGGTSEDREYRALTAQANVGSVVEAVMEHRLSDGANAELQKHHGLAPNQIPLDLLRVEEHRAVTPSPTNVGTVEDPVILPVFAAGVGAFLSIDRPQVPMGDAVFPIMTSRPTVGGPHADSTDVAETTGEYDAELIAPDRVQASFIHRRRDAARFAGLDSSLRAALNSGLEEKLDYEAITGAAGLLHGTNLANHNSTEAATFANYLSRFAYGRVDGRYASQTTDVRAVVGSKTYEHMGLSYRSDDADFTVLDSLTAKTGGVRVSAHVIDPVSHKQNAVIRLGSRRDMVQPVWAGVTLIVDEVTLSGKGEIEISAVMLMNTKILRADGFHKQQSVLS